MIRIHTFKYFKRDFNRWSIAVLTIVFIIAFPIATIFFELFKGPGETWGHLVENVLSDYIINSVVLMLGCSLLSLILGVSSAWIVSRYNFPFQRVFEWMLILPLAIPSYITAYAYAGIFDYGGTLAVLSRNLLNIDQVRWDIMNIYGLIFILSISLYPYVYVSTRAIFLTQSNYLLEASRLLRAGEVKTLLKVALPIARPAIIAGLILVLMEVLNDYGAAKYYGISTFTTGIFRSWFALEEPETAVYLSAILILIIGLLLWIEKKQRGKRGFSSPSTQQRTLLKRKTKPAQKITCLLIVGFPLLFGFILPLSQLLFWAYLTFEKVFTSDFVHLALQSLWIAVLAAILTTSTALLLIYFNKWNRFQWVKGISKITVLGYAVPGAVIAVGVMLSTLAFDKWFVVQMEHFTSTNAGFIINGTIIGLIYAYMVRFMAVGYNPIQAGVKKIGNQFTESSRNLGSGFQRIFLSVELPLIKRALLSGILLVFVDIMKELPLTLILKPYHINTLAVKAYEYASDELIAESALPALCIILTGILPILFLNRLIRTA